MIECERMLHKDIELDLALGGVCTALGIESKMST